MHYRLWETLHIVYHRYNASFESQLQNWDKENTIRSNYFPCDREMKRDAEVAFGSISVLQFGYEYAYHSEYASDTVHVFVKYYIQDQQQSTNHKPQASPLDIQTK